MTEIDRNELVTRTHDHLNRYITLADNKASLLLTAQLAFLGLFANALTELQNVPELTWWSGMVSAGLAVVGIFLSGCVVYPRMPKPDEGLFFWENILEYGSITEFQKAVEELEDKAARKHLVAENYNLATVAHTKYYFLRWSLRVTAGMIVLAVVAGVKYLFF